jgi:hypothetical protein
VRRYTRQEQSLGADGAQAAFAAPRTMALSRPDPIPSPLTTPPDWTQLHLHAVEAASSQSVQRISACCGTTRHPNLSVIDDHTTVDRANAPYAKLVFTHCQLHLLTLLFIGHGPFPFETFPRQVPDSFNFALLARDAYRSHNVICSASSKVQHCPAANWSGFRPHQGRQPVSTRRQRPALGALGFNAEDLRR